MNDTVEVIRHLVRTVEANPDRRGVFSTGEFLAVALVLNRHDWLEAAHYTMLEAIERLGRDWYEASLQVQRSGW